MVYSGPFYSSKHFLKGSKALPEGQQNLPKLNPSTHVADILSSTRDMGSVVGGGTPLWEAYGAPGAPEGAP